MTKFCRLIGDRMKDFLATRSKSLRWFSRESKVSYTTIYRLSSGEQKALSFLNARKILKVLEPDTYLNILGEYLPDETREYLSTLHAEPIVKAFAADLPLYEVFVYAAETPNANRTSLLAKSGADGISRLNRLIEIGAIKEIDNGFVDAIKGIVYPSVDALKQVSIHHFDMVSLDSPGSALENFRGALSDEGIVEWHEAKVAFVKKLHKILDEKKGANVVVASLIMGPTAQEEIKE